MILLIIKRAKGKKLLSAAVRTHTLPSGVSVIRKTQKSLTDPCIDSL